MRKSILWTASLLALLTASASASTNAFAAPATNAQPSTPTTTQAAARVAHAWARLDVGQTKPYVGQAVPITVTAFFRDVEGVTLEGGVQLKTKSIVTSELLPEPHQSTEIVNGVPTLVVRFTGTLTPSSEGPLDLSVSMPVKIRWREAAPRVVVREDPSGTADDPFADFGNDPFDSSAIMQRMQRRMQEMQRSFEQPAGRVHEELATLEAHVPPLDVKALPSAGKPATFTGAVGRYSLSATVSSAHVQVSEPVTLRVMVDGTGDLDRVDLSGVQSSDTWKAYPPKSTVEAAAKGKAARKIFEQVIVPLHGGDLIVPPVSFTAFDPVTSRYQTSESAPLSVNAVGDAAPALSATAAPIASSPSSAPEVDKAPGATSHLSFAFANERNAKLGALGAFLVTMTIALGLALRSLLAKRNGERDLRKRMKRAANEGSAKGFFDAAHDLIELRLARTWGVANDQITPASIEERMGEKGEALTEVLHAHDAVRFARGGTDGADLGALCKAVEQSLKRAS